MFKLCAFVALIAMVGAQNSNDAYAQVTQLRNTPNGGDGSYSYDFQTQNGISQQETGVGGQSAQGSATWYSPEGEPVQISYIADAYGYRVAGSHLPTPPPVPEAIQRSLEYIRTHPPQFQHQQQFF